MKKAKFFFVVLHYQTVNDTRACIESIRDCCRGSLYHVIVVDNASPNKSGALLMEEYKGADDVEVIISKKNLGFAKGNNLGFSAAKEMGADYIILSNSDVKILSRDFCRLVESEFKRSSFAVLGPREVQSDGRTHPIELKLKSEKDIRRRIALQQNMLDHYWACRLWLWMKRQVRRALIFLGVIMEQSVVEAEKRHTNAVLHGAFLVFSKVYIEKFDGLDPRTFLYGEEPLLQLRLERNGMSSVYNPKIEILHSGSSATKEFVGGERKRRIQFYARHEIESLKILLDEMENGKISKR